MPLLDNVQKLSRFFFGPFDLSKLKFRVFPHTPMADTLQSRSPPSSHTNDNRRGSDDDDDAADGDAGAPALTGVVDPPSNALSRTGDSDAATAALARHKPFRVAHTSMYHSVITSLQSLTQYLPPALVGGDSLGGGALPLLPPDAERCAVAAVGVYRDRDLVVALAFPGGFQVWDMRKLAVKAARNVADVRTGGSVSLLHLLPQPTARQRSVGKRDAFADARPLLVYAVEDGDGGDGRQQDAEELRVFSVPKRTYVAGGPGGGARTSLFPAISHVCGGEMGWAASTARCACSMCRRCLCRLHVFPAYSVMMCAEEVPVGVNVARRRCSGPRFGRVARALVDARVDKFRNLGNRLRAFAGDTCVPSCRTCVA